MDHDKLAALIKAAADFILDSRGGVPDSLQERDIFLGLAEAEHKARSLHVGQQLQEVTLSVQTTTQNTQ